MWPTIEPTSSLSLSDYGYPICFVRSNDGNSEMLWASVGQADSKKGYICVFDPGYLEAVRVLACREEGKFYALCCLDGALVVAISESGLLLVWEVGDFKLVSDVQTEHQKAVMCAKVNEGTKTVWSADQAGGVLVWKKKEEGEGLEQVVKLEIDQPIFSIEEVGQTMWIGTLGRIHQVHSTSFTLLESWGAHSGLPIAGIVHNPTSQNVWTYSDSPTICVWNAESAELSNTIREIPHKLLSLDAVPSSTLMIAGLCDHSVYLTESSTGDVTQLWKGVHKGPVRSMNISGTSRSYPLVTGGLGGHLKVWGTSRKRARTVKPIQKLEHKFRTKTLRKISCQVCNKPIKGIGLYCKVCEIAIHQDCRGSLTIECKKQQNVAFPGIPMHGASFALADSGPSHTDFSRMGGKSESKEDENHEKVRLRYFDPSTPDVPFMEKIFPATLKGVNAKEDMLIAISEMKRMKTNLTKDKNELGRSRSNSSSSSVPSGESSLRATSEGGAGKSLKIKPPKPQRTMTYSGAAPPPSKVIVLHSGNAKEDESSVDLVPSNYVYKIPGFEVFIRKEDLPFHRMQYIQACKLVMLPPILDVVPVSEMHKSLENVDMNGLSIDDFMEQRTRQICMYDLSFTPKIRRLMGDVKLNIFVGRECDEVLDFRRALALERIRWYDEKKELEKKDPHRLPRYFCSKVTQEMIDRMGKICLEGHLKLDKEEGGPQELNAKKMISLTCDTSVDDALAEMCEGISKTLPGKNQIYPEDYILKVPGMQEYLYGDAPLVAYDHIRSSVGPSKDQMSRISLRLVRVSETDHEEVESESLADQLLSQDMTRPKEFSEEPVSIYKMTSKLAVTICGVKV